ncbi:MAG TPA: aldolase/citrate lyase family protein [Opitutaceae bacterium]|nr:aldolase/citrate lyase family protein [Opitutaceae bacterium]
MKMTADFRNRVLAGEWLAGTWLNLGSALTAEMAGLAGFDWVLLDHEHGPGSDTTVLHQLQAVSATPAAGLVRIAANEPPRFKRVLDAGAHGVMVPYVNSADEARGAVASLRYPPRGMRGVAKLNRAAAFGGDFDAYFAHAHEWLVTAVQIETAEGLDRVDEIAAVDGADVIFAGPLDLTANLGITGQYNHPTFLDALKRIASAAKRAGKAAGILLLDPAQLGMARDLGYSFVALGSDGGSVNAALRATAAAMKKKA